MVKGLDVFRLSRLLEPAISPAIPEVVREHMREFLARMDEEEIDFKSLASKGLTKDSVLEELRRIYQIT